MFKKLIDKINFKGDLIVLVVTIILSLISLYAVYSSTGKILTQLFHVALCFIGIYVFYKIDYRNLSQFSFLLLIIAFVLMIITLLTGEKGRAIEIFGQNFQTFYFIGFFVVFYISKFLALRLNKDEQLTSKEVLFLFLVIGLFCGGMALANLSTAIILFFTSLVVLFIGNVKLKYIFLFVFICMIGGIGILFLNIGRGDTAKNRLSYYFSSEKKDDKQPLDKATADYGRQMILAKAAISRSGLMPAGPGQGVIKKSLAQKDTDYIYSTVVEEVGIIVGIAILFAYLIFFYRSWMIARHSEGPFGMLLAIGIGFWFTCQALVHIGVNCELLPATGQTLPFISRGGASMLFSGIIVGTLLNISKNTAKQ